jgi:hypothetical protein
LLDGYQTLRLLNSVVLEVVGICVE